MIAKLLALVLPLGLDTFAVAAAIGLTSPDRQDRIRMSLLFTSFETGMPLIGLVLGAPLGHAIGGAAEYVAIVVLLGFGLYTLLSDDEQDEQQLGELARARGGRALLLGLSISLDELAIGFTLGLLRLPILLALVLIAMQAFIVTQIGLRVGGRFSERFRENTERVAGIALTLLAVVLLAERLLS